MMPKAVEPPNPGSFILRFVWKTNQRNGRRSTSTFNIGVEGLKNCSRKRAASFLGLSAMEIFIYIYLNIPKKVYSFKCFYEKNFISLNFFPSAFTYKAKEIILKLFSKWNSIFWVRTFFEVKNVRRYWNATRYWKIFVILCSFFKDTRFVTLFLGFLKYDFLEFKALLKVSNMEDIT